MVSAMKAVEDKELTISAPAVKFSVPRKTLGDRLKDHDKHGKKPGVARVLTVEEEAGLAATVHPEDLASDQDTGIMKDPGSVLQGSSESSRSENEDFVTFSFSRQRRKMPARYRSDSESDNVMVFFVTFIS